MNERRRPMRESFVVADRPVAVRLVVQCTVANMTVFNASCQAVKIKGARENASVVVFDGLIVAFSSACRSHPGLGCCWRQPGEGAFGCVPVRGF